MIANTALDISYLESIPEEWKHSLLGDIRQKFNEAKYKIIVLDDDPTGTQTVRDLPVLTHWSKECITNELLSEYPAFFLLTNSRALPEEAAIELAEEIGGNIKQASDSTGIRTVVISRSDSTLRGHFPAEVDALARPLEKDHLPYLLIPFFLEGGRYTLDDTHYVQEKSLLVPAAETVFAQDAAFGFSHSNLTKWIEEKTHGELRAEEVHSITLADIRRGGPERVALLLAQVEDGQACIVNAASYRDMEVVVSALQLVENSGKEFLYRTAASFVRTRTGLDQYGGLLKKDELVTTSRHGGLFVIGSYVEKTTHQIDVLFDTTDIVPIEINVEALLDEIQQDAEIKRTIHNVSLTLRDGKDVALYTSRKLVKGDDANTSLEIGKTVSLSLIRVVKNIAVQPRYLVAKGGITSSDVATEALGIKRAMVIGQAQPGVPAWQCGAETAYPGMSFIIFPGNVGNDDALAKLQQTLK